MSEDYKKENEDNKFEASMSFFDHLEELRWRIIKSAIGIVLGSILCGIFIEWIMNTILLSPAKSTNPPLVLINLKPYGQLVLYMEVILVGGVIISVPNIFYQFWKFVQPGLLPSERHYIWWVVFFTTFCFLAGAVFSYFVILPTALKFFAAFGTEAITNNIAVNEYFSFILSMIITAGVVFELPMVSYFLSRLGLLTPSFMKKYRRHAVVVILIIAGIVTPGPDITSQVLLGLPLFLLYEISIMISRFAQKKRIEKEAN
jgi:sec-independent protein translocase protein TatC